MVRSRSRCNRICTFKCTACMYVCLYKCLLVAVSSAMFILRLGDFSNRFDPAEINGTSFFTGRLHTIVNEVYVCMYVYCMQLWYVCI